MSSCWLFFETPINIFITSRSVLLSVRNFSDKFVEDIKTRFYVQGLFIFSKIVHFFVICEKKYCFADQATDNNMAHAHCTLDTTGYKHTLKLCNTYYFSTATTVARTRSYVTVYIHRLSCYPPRMYRNYVANYLTAFVCILFFFILLFRCRLYHHYHLLRLFSVSFNLSYISVHQLIFFLFLTLFAYCFMFLLTVNDSSSSSSSNSSCNIIIIIITIFTIISVISNNYIYHLTFNL